MGQVVVSAEWIAAIRHLVEIGAISVAGAAEALRVRGFTSAMAQATDLPQSVKDLLGEGPTTDAMKVTNTTGAGAACAPRHHVLPQEHRNSSRSAGSPAISASITSRSSSRPRIIRRSTAAATGWKGESGSVSGTNL
ncbi:MAG TPA: hypothetical protein VNO30_04095 [Kofleriaceae bacterium]|nr:hypothetical protein [Kofleriaceae bacterium]